MGSLPGKSFSRSNRPTEALQGHPRWFGGALAALRSSSAWKNLELHSMESIYTMVRGIQEKPGGRDYPGSHTPAVINKKAEGGRMSGLVWRTDREIESACPEYWVISQIRLRSFHTG